MSIYYVITDDTEGLPEVLHQAPTYTAAVSWAADQNGKSAVTRKYRFVMDTGSLMAHEMHSVLMDNPLLRSIYESGRAAGRQAGE